MGFMYIIISIRIYYASLSSGLSGPGHVGVRCWISRTEGGLQMAIGVQMEFPGATLAQYDQVIQKMGFRLGGPGAPGGLFHWVTKTDAGIRVVDVWESREQYEKFSAERVRP